MDWIYLFNTLAVKYIFKLGLAVLIFLNTGIFAQTVAEGKFELLGQVNIDSGKIVLIPFADTSLYPEGVDIREQYISNGRFYFSGNIDYPYSYIIQIFNNLDQLIYVSNPFLIDSGSQQVKCNINVPRETPDIMNQICIDKRKIFDWMNREVNQKIHDFYTEEEALNDQYENNPPPEIIIKNKTKLELLARAKDSILWKYVQRYPESYIGLWELVGRLNNGYKPMYDSIYVLFDEKIQQSPTGKKLKIQLSALSSIQVGRYFPRMELHDMDNNNKLLEVNNNKKFLLIDFWFSDCFPCISQFGKLKQLFRNYDNTFDIISISVDGYEEIENWKSVIKKHGLMWNQYLDLNGRLTKELSINSFPTNFLLDQSGKILFVNIDLGILEALLQNAINLSDVN